MSIAVQLKSEGYNKFVFDRPIEACRKIVRVHVYGEDELGLRMAVYCVNKPSQVRSNKILDFFEIVKSYVEDCDVALAFPLSLFRKAGELIGLANRVYMVDGDGRVWVHYPWNGAHNKALWPPLILGNSAAEEDPESLKGQVEGRLRRCGFPMWSRRGVNGNG